MGFSFRSLGEIDDVATGRSRARRAGYLTRLARVKRSNERTPKRTSGHDLHVTKEYQRRGVALMLLGAVEKEARELGCCKLTLEVQENNRAALAPYERYGFVGGHYEPEARAVQFRQKNL